MLCNSTYCPFIEKCKRHVSVVPVHQKRFKDVHIKDFTISIVIRVDGLWCYKYKEKVR